MGRKIIIFGILLLGCDPAVFANLITNGNFENPGSSLTTDYTGLTFTGGGAGNSTQITGWTARPGNGDGPGVYYATTGNGSGWIPNPESGSYLVQLDSTDNGTAFTTGSRITQTLSGANALVAGQAYSLSFWINTETGAGKGGTSYVMVIMTGAYTFTSGTTQFGVTNGTPGSTVTTAVWALETLNFTATSSGNLTITFEDSPASVNSNSSIDNIDLEAVPEMSHWSVLGVFTLGCVAVERLRKWKAPASPAAV